MCLFILPYILGVKEDIMTTKKTSKMVAVLLFFSLVEVPMSFPQYENKSAMSSNIWNIGGEVNAKKSR